MDWFQIEADHLGQNCPICVEVLGDRGEVFYEMALRMLEVIETNNRMGKPTLMIVPVGPVGQYPIFTRLVQSRRVSLRNVYFLNMDEYLQENGSWIDLEHRLSFRGFMQREVYSRIDPELLMPEAQRIFPDPRDLEAPVRLIERMGGGGVDLCVGGLGINGHLAFNEPEEQLSIQEFAHLPARVVCLSRETRTINAVGDLNGAIDAMPQQAVTLGMREILSARKILLGVFRDWHRAALRQALYADPSSHFPATLLQMHPDVTILATEQAAKRPF